jgi:hypothetical protein
MPADAPRREKMTPFALAKDFPAARKWAAPPGAGSEVAVARLGLCWIPRQEAEFGALMSGVGDGSGHRRVSVILTRQNHEEPFQ